MCCSGCHRLAACLVIVHLWISKNLSRMHHPFLTLLCRFSTSYYDCLQKKFGSASSKHFKTMWAQANRWMGCSLMHGANATKGTGPSLSSTCASKRDTPPRRGVFASGFWNMRWTQNLLHQLLRPWSFGNQQTMNFGKRKHVSIQSCRSRRLDINDFAKQFAVFAYCLYYMTCVLVSNLLVVFPGVPPISLPLWR